MFFKRKEKVVYMPIDEPMSQIDLAGAFNVQKDDPLRRAINQTLNKMREDASTAHPSMIDNLGKLAYSNGYEQAILDVMKELHKCYEWGRKEIIGNSELKETTADKRGY